MRAVKEKANAKLNLYLDVISRREDGFHDVKTVMHSVSLSDEITVVYTPSGSASVKMHVSGNRYLPIDERNLAVRAAQIYLETSHKTASIEIKLHKRIPVAAGLAGGSSDAAATLRAMNKLFGKLFTDRALYKMAEKLGSDVPYCLYGKTALCEGRGDIITKRPDSLRLNVVVAVANERVATPSAYAKLDEIFSSFDGSVQTGGEECFNSFITDLNNGQDISASLFNVFETAVLPTCDGAVAIKKRLVELGATGALMSGSGPSVFGIFNRYEDALRACAKLREEKVLAYAATSV